MHKKDDNIMEGFHNLKFIEELVEYITVQVNRLREIDPEIVERYNEVVRGLGFDKEDK